MIHSLSDLEKLARSLDEYPRMDAFNPLHPEFTQYHKSHMPSFFQKIAQKILPNRWSLPFFYSLLKRVLKQRHAQKYPRDFLQKLTLSTPADFLVVGNLHGAFHSLVRILREMQQRGWIDESFRLQRKELYLLFTGNVINSSPFNLETLTTLFLLMLANPNQVFYIQGDHEREEHWHDFSLKNELLYRAQFLSTQKPPWNAEINDFFETLPKALYIHTLSPNEEKWIRVSSAIDLEEERFSDFLKDRNTPLLSTESLESFQKNPSPCPIDLQIQCVQPSLLTKKKGGFHWLTESKTLTCSLFSSPTPTYQDLFECYEDVFLFFNSSSEMLQEYSRDVRTKDPFEVHDHPISSKEQIQKDAKQGLVLGCSLDLSQTSSFLGKRLRAGIELGTFLHRRNLDSSSSAWMRPIFLDDGYTPHRAYKNLERLLQFYHTDLLFSPLGTPTTATFLPLVEEKKVALLFPYTGASLFRKKELSHVLHFRASYQEEAKALIQYAVETLKLKRIAVFYQNDTYGLDGLTGTKEALKTYSHIEPLLEVSYSRNNPDIGQAANQISEHAPEAIVFISTYSPSVSLVHALSAANLHNKVLMGVSFLTDVFKNFLKNKGIPFILSRVTPDYREEEMELTARYREIVRTHHEQTIENADSFEGYINVLILAEILKQISPPFTKEKILETGEKFAQFSLQGLPLHFNPETRSLSNTVWLEIPEGGI